MDFFFNDTATTEIYTLSLHDALPISWLYDGVTIATRGQPVPRGSAGRVGWTSTQPAVMAGPLPGTGTNPVLGWKKTRLYSNYANNSLSVLLFEKKTWTCKSCLYSS